jgi:hypothetical protein
MMETILRDFRQPEYIHVLLNPIPIYGLAVGLLGLVIALFLRSRQARIATLAIVLLSAASAWPVYEFGENAYDRVLSMADEPGQAWLDEHKDRAEDLIWFFYGLAVLSATAIAVPMKRPRSALPLALGVLLLGLVSLGTGGYIAHAGGKIRHREFRNASPPPRKPAEQS